MGYQFLHLEGYARHGSRQGNKGRKWSASEIAAEAMRDPDACPHVEQPRAPKVLYGGTPREAAELAEGWANSARDAQGRALRRDGLALAAGVVSLPAEQAQDWPRFREATVAWLKDQYGERLCSVVEHTDETHPHLHFYAVPLAGERFEVLHPGRQAAAEKARQGAKKGAQNTEYKRAMMRWQDDFARVVGANFGLARLGPGRRRLTRKEWQAEQAQARALATVELPKAVGLSARDVGKLVLEARTLRPDLVESDADQAKRLNALFAKRAAPLLAAARQAKPAREQADRLARETTLLRAKNDALQARLAMFTPAEIEAAQERQQQRDEAEQMKQAEAFLAAQEQQAQNDELLRLAAENMVAAGEAISLEKADRMVEDLLAGGYEKELLRWVEWKPVERPAEPLQKRPKTSASRSVDGPEPGR